MSNSQYSYANDIKKSAKKIKDRYNNYIKKVKTSNNLFSYNNKKDYDDLVSINFSFDQLFVPTNIDLIGYYQDLTNCVDKINKSINEEWNPMFIINYATDLESVSEIYCTRIGRVEKRTKIRSHRSTKFPIIGLV